MWFQKSVAPTAGACPYFPRERRRLMKRAAWTFAAALAVAVMAACMAQKRNRKESGGPQFTHPTQITNPYLPLSRLKQQILEGKEDGKAMRIERTRLDGVKVFSI